MRLVVALGVTLLAVIGAATAKPSPAGSCSKNEEGVTYGVASDCHKYLVCQKGSLAVKECKNQSYYDTITGKCVDASVATCAVETNPEPEPEPEPVPEPEESDEQYDYLCQKVLYGVRVHPNACDKYLVCNKDKATIVQCAEGFIFVADFVSCVPGNKVSCTIQSDEPSTTESLPTTSVESNESESNESESEDESSETAGQYDYLCVKTLLGSVAHPETCTKYILCYKNKATEQSCKSGYSYSSKLHLCVKQSNGECADAPQEQPTTEGTTTEPEPTKPVTEEPGSGEESSETAGQYDYLCAKTLLGSVAHPETCTKYISCYKNKATEQSCKSGYSYSSKLHLCVKQNNGGCADAPQEQPTTEGTTTEPEPTKPVTEEPGSGEGSSETAGQYDYLCAKTLLGSVAHPETCTKYISCYKNKATEQSCKSGYSYSSKLHLCVKQSNGGCADAPQEQPTTEGTTTEPEPTEPVTEEPGSGEESSETAGQYDYLCAKLLLGTVSHPESCTKYILCYKNKAMEQSCSEGYYFSGYLQLCIKGNSETCANNNGGNHGTSTNKPSPPTEEPTTTTELIPPAVGGDPGEINKGCVEGFTGYLPIANDCTSYVYCFQGEPGVKSCLKDYIYYDPFKACLPGDQVLCQLYSV